MTNEQLLEKQIEMLEKLLQLKEAVIEELENKIARIQSIGNTPYITNIPSVWTTYKVPLNQDMCTDGTPHAIPSPWLSVTAPYCTKCGATVSTGSTVTVTANNNQPTTNIVPFNNIIKQ